MNDTRPRIRPLLDVARSSAGASPAAVRAAAQGLVAGIWQHPDKTRQKYLVWIVETLLQPIRRRPYPPPRPTPPDAT
jgi:hypothetical protein